MNRVKFYCTGMCGEDHPVHDHCKACSHANFKVKAGSVTVYFCPLFGCDFYANDGRFNPPENSYLWEVAKELAEHAERNFKRWEGKKK